MITKAPRKKVRNLGLREERRGGVGIKMTLRGGGRK
jgi:hypothetical protein